MESGTAAGKRRYRMKARAEASAETAERIVAAAQAAVMEMPPGEVTLAAIAERAGVSVQTVLERFGSKERLLGAAIARIGGQIADQRSAAPAGDPAAAARIMVEHYEEVGDAVVRALGEEDRFPAVAEMLQVGRDYHRDWCERVFSPTLAGLAGVERKRRLAQLMTVTDVYAWKVLRRDRRLSARQTETAMRELIEALAEPGS